MTDIAVTSYHLSQVEVVKQWGCNADIPRGIEVVDDNGTYPRAHHTTREHAVMLIDKERLVIPVRVRCASQCL